MLLFFSPEDKSLRVLIPISIWIIVPLALYTVFLQHCYGNSFPFLCDCVSSSFSLFLSPFLFNPPSLPLSLSLLPHFGGTYLPGKGSIGNPLFWELAGLKYSSLHVYLIYDLTRNRMLSSNHFWFILRSFSIPYYLLGQFLEKPDTI